MAGFIKSVDCGPSVLFPGRLDAWIAEDSLARVVDLLVEELDLPLLGFARSPPCANRPVGYHPSLLFIYGYLNPIPSSRGLACEAGRNVEVTWLTSKLVPDHKSIADFRREFERSASFRGIVFP